MDKRYKVIVVGTANGPWVVPNLSFETELNKLANDGWRLHSYSHCCEERVIFAVLVNDNV